MATRITTATDTEKAQRAHVEKFRAIRNKARAEARARYLAEGYIECIVPKCTGLVAPKYQFDLDGTLVGECPRTDDHKRLGF